MKNKAQEPAGATLPDPSIFRAYDIRGLVDTQLTSATVELLGRIIGTKIRAAAQNAQQAVAVAGDGRLSTPALKSALLAGLTKVGMDVLDIGQVPTPLLYFATRVLPTPSGIMITGSHNPPEYNGLKIVVEQTALDEDGIADLYQCIKDGTQIADGQVQGQVKQTNLHTTYIDHVSKDIRLRRALKIVVDCGNGVAGETAPQLFNTLGCQVTPLYCEIDGRFPNHHPDPAVPANLADLSHKVCQTGADLGIAFDGDGDRLGIVTNKGRIIAADRLLMLFSKDLLKHHPGAVIIHDVKCTRHLGKLIEAHGGQPILWQTGHSHLKAKIRETGALLGGEYSGHICFADRWYGFDDALYSAARLLEILADTSTSADELFLALPEDVSTPELKIHTTEDAKFSIIEALKQQCFSGGTVNTIDGIRVDYPDGWGLIRASNTSPTLTLRFEAENMAALNRIRNFFSAALARVTPQIKIPDSP